MLDESFITLGNTYHVYMDSAEEPYTGTIENCKGGFIAVDVQQEDEDGEISFVKTIINLSHVVMLIEAE